LRAAGSVLIARHLGTKVRHCPVVVNVGQDGLLRRLHVNRADEGVGQAGERVPAQESEALLNSLPINSHLS
jgi:hypothetical protein